MIYESTTTLALVPGHSQGSFPFRFTIKAAEEVEKLSNDLEAATKAKEQNPFNLTPGHLSDVEVQVATALL